mgnify:CR=1 FL=1
MAPLFSGGFRAGRAAAGLRILDFSSATAINETVITYKEPLSSNPVYLIFN